MPDSAGDAGFWLRPCNGAGLCIIRFVLSLFAFAKPECNNCFTMLADVFDIACMPSFGSGMVVENYIAIPLSNIRDDIRQ